jgi:hypothetical protein
MEDEVESNGSSSAPEPETELPRASGMFPRRADLNIEPFIRREPRPEPEFRPPESQADRLAFLRSHPYKSARNASRIARLALAVSGALALARAANDVFTLLESGLDSVLRDAGAMRFALDVHLWLARVLPVGIAASILVAGFFFVSWLTRAQEAAVALSGAETRHGRVGAMLWWLVPIASWFMPYRVVREVQLRSDPGANEGRSAWLARAWWIAWLSVEITAVPIVLSQSSDASAEHRIALFADQAIVTFLAACLAIAVVARIQGSQDRVAGGYEAARVGLRTLRLPAIATALALVLVAVAAFGEEHGSTDVPELAWSVFRPLDGGFSVELPGTPIVSIAGAAPGSVTSWSTSSGTTAYSVELTRVPPSANPTQTFAQLQNSYISLDQSLVFGGPTKVDGYPARSVLIHNSNAGYWIAIRMTITGQSLFLVSAVYRGSRPPGVSRMLDSFHPSPPEPST